MTKLQRFLALLFRPFFNKIPDPKTIDKTGIIKSDHPKIGNGWIKGWLVDTPNRNIIIVCKHSNPTILEPNNTVFARDSKGIKHIRTIIDIDKALFKIEEEKSTHKFDYYIGSDIAICKLDKPFPRDVKAYKISTRQDNLAEKTVTFDQDGKISIAQIRFTENLAWIKGKNRSNILIAGDSGIPWFVWEDKEWKVLTHTTKSHGGEGPWYSHPFIFKDLMKRIKKLETHNIPQ